MTAGRPLDGILYHTYDKDKAIRDIYEHLLAATDTLDEDNIIRY